MERKHGKKECVQNKARSLTKGDNLVELDPSSEGFFGLPSLEGTSQVTDLGEEREVSLLCEQVALLELREVKLLSKCEVAWSEASQLWEELEVFGAEVTCLQASLLENPTASPQDLLT
ncbi:hypothetical protein ACLOJK_019661 [Asimina triloba]